MMGSVLIRMVVFKIVVLVIPQISNPLLYIILYLLNCTGKLKVSWYCWWSVLNFCSWLSFKYFLFWFIVLQEIFVKVLTSSIHRNTWNYRGMICFWFLAKLLYKFILLWDGLEQPVIVTCVTIQELECC